MSATRRSFFLLANPGFPIRIFSSTPIGLTPGLVDRTEDNLKRNGHVTPQGAPFARFLPIDTLMRQTSSSVEALIEVLDLCEQALTAIRNVGERLIPEPLADKYRQSRQNTPVKFDRKFVLIHGGLSSQLSPLSALSKPLQAHLTEHS